MGDQRDSDSTTNGHGHGHERGHEHGHGHAPAQAVDRDHGPDHGHGDGHAPAQAVGHGHGHGHGRGRGVRAVLRKIGHAVAPHSHDSADKTDTALETSSRGMRVLAVSFAVLMVTAAVQAVIVVASGSVALLGDTLHN